MMLLFSSARAQVVEWNEAFKTDKSKNNLFSSAVPCVTPPSNKTPLFVKYELPKGAVFCRMEEKLWHKFNVWIKLRAGSDEMYRQLISTH
jgi:hypothetical protein